MTQSSTLQTAECDKGMDMFYGPLEDSLLEDSRTTLVATDLFLEGMLCLEEIFLGR